MEATARPGNIALDISRPLFEQGPNWPFKHLKNLLLGKPLNDNLPELHFMDGKSSQDD